MTELKRIFLDENADGGMTNFRRYIVVGELGAVQIVFMKLPDIPGHPWNEEFFPGGWTGTDVGYHAYRPKFERHEPMPCDILEGVDECYYSGSSLPALEIAKEWHAAGQDDELVWNAAEWFYRAKYLDQLPGESSFEEKMLFLMEILFGAEATDGEDNGE